MADHGHPKASFQVRSPIALRLSGSHGIDGLIDLPLRVERMHGQANQGLQTMRLEIRPGHLHTRHGGHDPSLGQARHGSIRRFESAVEAHDPAPPGPRIVQPYARHFRQTGAEGVGQTPDALRDAVNADIPGVADCSSKADLPRDMAFEGFEAAGMTPSVPSL